MRRSRVSSLIFAALALAALPSHLAAQLPPTSSTTSTPVPGAGHDYLGSQLDTVNPASGSISVRIPATIPPSRGITLPFSFAYDSNGVNYVSNGGQSAQWSNGSSTVTMAGWSNSVPAPIRTATPP